MNWPRFQPDSDSTNTRRRGIILAAGIGVVAGTIMLAFILHKPGVTLPAETPRPAVAAATVTGWRIELAGDSSEFNAFVPSGKVAFIPAGSEFIAAPAPASSRGDFEERLTGRGWRQTNGLLRAPIQPGLYTLEWHCGAGVPREALVPASATNQAVATLDVLVLARAESEKRGAKTMLSVNGKSIGGYLDPLDCKLKRVRDAAARYQPPKFFGMLDASSIDLRVGPDFDLGMLIAFKDKRVDGVKVYTTERHTDVFPLRPELIDKLVKLRERLRLKGVSVTRFGITSAFRTPDYNKSVGGTPYSRHCYGDAVDLYIDEDNNHRMDDLNGDGKFDRKDGLIVANACRELELEGAVVPGGIGLYEWHGDDSVRSHVHIDCRGYISRWGNIEGGKRFKWWPAEEFQDEDGD